MLSGEMSKNKKILFSGIFLAVFVVLFLVIPVNEAHAAAWYEDMVNYAVYLVFLFLSMFFAVIGKLFDYVIDPNMFQQIIGSEAVYNSWKMVRDSFNVMFILVLLFSAFSTIFQVDKYHIKKILLTLVIIALLVNFSYPIAIFIIDASNVTMYYLLGKAFPDAGSISAGYAKFSKIADMLVPNNGGNLNLDAPHLFSKLLMAIAFMFMLAATMLVMALTFLMRVIVLTMLVIFSPAAFIAGILPSTKNHFDSWWTNLFKYSFLGPIMAFMMLVGLKLLIEMEGTVFPAIKGSTPGQVSDTGDPSFIASAVYFFIPIVIMWVGLIVAQKSGAVGAEVAMKAAKGAAKSVTGYNAVKKRYDAFSAERKKRADEKFKGNIGEKIGKWANRTQDTAWGKARWGEEWYKGLPGSKGAGKRAKTMRENENKEKIKKGADGLIDEGKTIADLSSDLNKAFREPAKTKEDMINQAKQAAAYQRMDRDDRKQHIKDDLQSGGRSYNHVLQGATDKVRGAADRIKAGGKDEDDLRMVSSYVNEQAKKVVNTGATAQDKSVVGTTAKKAADKIKSFRGKKTNPPDYQI